jgi:hypothetical protein
MQPSAWGRPIGGKSKGCERYADPTPDIVSILDQLLGECGDLGSTPRTGGGKNHPAALQNSGVAKAKTHDPAGDRAGAQQKAHDLSRKFIFN